MFLPLKRSYPLRLHISTLFILLMLLACGSISLLFYVKSRDMVKSESQKLVSRVVSETTREIERLFGPPETLVNMLARSALVEDEKLEDRLAKLPLLREALEGVDEIASGYVGYPDGDFFQFRRLRDDLDRKVFDAPENARWMVQSIDGRPDQRVEKRFLFFSRDLELLETREWDTDYDPRRRSWYRQAVDTAEAVRGSPYVFFTDRKLGITFARSLLEKGVVAGMDVRLETLSELMLQFKITPNSQVLLFEKNGQLIAHEAVDKLTATDAEKPDQSRRRKLDQVGEPVLDALDSVRHSVESGGISEIEFEAAGEPWIATIGQLDLDGGPPVLFSMLIPYLELTAEVRNIRNQTVLLTLAIVLALVPVTLTMARAIARPISKLADEAAAVSRLDFGERGRVRSVIAEVENLSRTMAFMRRTIAEFLGLIESLNREKNFDALLDRIGDEVRRAAGADGVLICMIDEDRGTLSPDVYCDAATCSRSLDLPDFHLGDDLPLVAAVKGNARTRWDLTPESAAGLEVLLGPDRQPVTVWCVPLEDRQNNSMGVIGLIYRDLTGANETEGFLARLGFVERLSGLAGVTLETKQLIKKQKELFDAFIKLIAGAIDAKSPYTGGHCQRVPVIAKMLAEAACTETEGPLADFDLTEEQWEELHVAAWLHDCGKVTTPEYVVDKATKLETIYDRIHEVRMRFEVLKRDVRITYWKSIAGGGRERELRERLSAELAQLDDDFEFIARCNEGGEFLADESVERIHEIAEKTWVRTLDDRIGVSWEEGQRKNRSPAVPAPAEERLLSDRDEHLFTRGATDHIEADNRWGFKLEEPRHLYNRGEVHNLEVRRGTLSFEERFKINDHIVQTIKMLEELPYPRHLRNVPEIAGGHHETLHGTGYPRKLTGDQMSVAAKMMVIADVFEALTASDRPYKKPKKLSDALKIMAMMQKGGHFDPDLYRLFLTRGVYRQYGEQYLEPSQIDDVDIEPYLAA